MKSNYRNNMTREERYTTPITQYRYRRLSWDDYMSNKYLGYRTVRSSIIPVVNVDNQTYWLLGSFWDYPKEILADFGGDCFMWEPPAVKGKPRPRSQERNRQAPFGCSMIELFEESKGLLVKPVLESLGTFDNKWIKIYEGLDGRKKERVIFMFVPLIYDNVKDIPVEFDKIKHHTEKLGPLDFYLEEDLLNNKYMTTRNLTDFINYIKY